MTVAELAALAAKVEGFERPRVCCSLCRGSSLAWGTEPCLQCGCTGWTDDDSPAALLMAVMLYARKHHGDVWLLGSSVQVSVMRKEKGGISMPSRRESIPVASEESIACAALVALLRANGVGVGDEPTASTPGTTAS
jgi:hypothetical protein